MTDDERAMLTTFWEERIPFNAFLGMKVTMMEEGSGMMVATDRS